MTDQFNEQISQFIDDEMSFAESDFFVRRLQNDAEARRQYLRYQLIGAAVRGEHSQHAGIDSAHSLERALEAADETLDRPAAKWSQLATGAGIAASVALVVVFGLRFVTLGSDYAPTLTSDASTGIEPAGNVVPQGMVESQQMVRVPAEVTGIQYLIHHARYSSSVSRTIMQSGVIAAQATDPINDISEEAFLVE